MRALIDYRPALRERSGVGEYTHELARALLSAYSGQGPNRALDLVLFSSSWKDRLVLPPALAGATAVDRRVPVGVLNFAWHRVEWPPIEWLSSQQIDVAHSSHPLLLPSRHAARIVTIHDLYFLAHPELARAEIRRDYPVLARAHARRADGIIVSSQFMARKVEGQFEVPSERIAVCPAGAPDWPPRAAPPAGGGYLLFFGTLEARKNVGGLLDAYEILLARRRDVPPLVLAGRATSAARPWLDRLARAPLAGVARHVGYVDPADRRALYDGARMLIQPSFEEGFGMTVLEAMTIGLPVVAANRGALPEVLGDAGPVVEPDEPEQMASAIERLLDDSAYASAASAKGVLRAAQFSWARTAERVYLAYQHAIEHRCASA
ncbi:MAG TPA: glycosyltransferase family 1 protein [Vicinamibacterales bacterium]|nr:glycosyltransferase family 1 protein [Vicinamibacterales bacterium]